MVVRTSDSSRTQAPTPLPPTSAMAHMGILPDWRRTDGSVSSQHGGCRAESPRAAGEGGGRTDLEDEPRRLERALLGHDAGQHVDRDDVPCELVWVAQHVRERDGRPVLGVVLGRREEAHGCGGGGGARGEQAGGGEEGRAGQERGDGSGERGSQLIGRLGRRRPSEGSGGEEAEGRTSAAR